MPTQPDTLIVSDYVVCATLRKVADVFEADLLWQRVRGGEGVYLLDALKRHRQVPLGRQRKDSSYHHILVRIPERDFSRDERLDEGAGRETLLQELYRLHQRDFGIIAAEETPVRYRIEADAVLRPGEVQFLFGRAIYVPDTLEQPLFEIQAAAEGQADWRELGPIYAGQRLTLLNGDRRGGSFAIAGWPFLNGESVLLMLRTDPQFMVDVLSEPAGSLNLAEDGEGGFLVRDRRGRALRLRVVACGARLESLPKRAAITAAPPLRTPPVTVSTVVADAPEAVRPRPVVGLDCPTTDIWGRREPVLGFDLQFDDPLQPQPLADWPTSPPAPTPSSAVLPASALPESESIPEQLTWIPQRPSPVVRVAGVALQRLSTYAAAGIRDWRISFNRGGGLVPGGHPEAVAWLRIDSQDRLFGEIVGSVTPLSLPGVWQLFIDLKLELYAAPPQMAGHYLGWAELPAPLRLPVPRERAVSFGRGSEADIAPRLLADPRSLSWGGEDAKTVGINAEYLGLSRRHLRLQARSDDWWVQLESQNMPVYRLAASGDLLETLSPTADTVTTAKPGELLVVGGYVLALGDVR